MPWKERSVMEERMRFVLRLKDSATAIPYVTSFGCAFVQVNGTGHEMSTSCR